MHRGSVRVADLAKWVALFALSAIACDESREGPSDNGGSAGAGLASGVSANAGVSGSAAGVAGSTAGVAGKGASGGAGVAGTAGSGGKSGSTGAAGSAGSATGGGGAGGASGNAGASGAAVDAGSAGEGGDSAGGAGAPPSNSAACSPDYVLCEDFESTDIGDIPEGWTRHGDESAVAVDEQRGKALRLGAIPEWERRIYHDASALGSAHWGRVYYRVELPVPDAFVHSTLVALSGDGPTRGRSEYRVVDTVKQAVDTPDVASRHQFLWNVQPEDSGEFGRGTEYDWFFDGEWHCAEYHIDASTQSYAFYLDGEEELAFENGEGNYSGTDIPDSFDTVRIGWINYQAAPPGFVAWLDDVAFDDERIGCE